VTGSRALAGIVCAALSACLFAFVAPTAALAQSIELSGDDDMTAYRQIGVEISAGKLRKGMIIEVRSGQDVHSYIAIGALKGLVNAVLRKVVDQGPGAWSALRVPRLPKWLRSPLVAAWGSDAVMAMEQVQFAGAPVDLSLALPNEGLVKKLDGQVLPTGSVRLRDARQISALPGYDEGVWWVQDAAAAIPVLCLDPKPNERIIDLCAAPGGKTLQLAAAGAQVVAVDTSEGRMARVRENLTRTGLQAELRVDDALNQTGQYDAVLLDAPCSATGTIRRHPDLPHAKDGSEFMALFDLQTRLLDHAWTLLRPGGRLVYCTCSLLPDEGEVQIEEALQRLDQISIDRKALERPGVDPAWISPEGGLRLRPHYWAEHGGMDGFYIAVLRKAG